MLLHYLATLRNFFHIVILIYSCLKRWSLHEKRSNLYESLYHFWENNNFSTKNIYLKLFPWISVICCILFPHVFCCILMVFQCALKYSICYLRFKTHPPVTCFMVEILYLGCFWILYIKIWLTQSINSCSTFASR